VDQTNDVLKNFSSYHVLIELRQLNRQDEEEPMGKIVYLVNLDTKVSTSKLSEQILSR
jgi:hypothetical protein